ncbi:MAG: EAL domain-containing protein [Gammaproteobacteria bacterium]|nr:EAL domain-containing protein [Gammaproteobacteria bacterium]
MSTLAKPDVGQEGEMLNLLLIEDDHNDYVMIADALRRYDYEQFNITRVSCVSDAIEVIESIKFDLIISELNLPDSNSASTVCKLGQYAELAPIIILTSVSDQRIGQMAISTGIEDYFAKDYLNDIDLLFKTINFAIERHRIKSQLRRARTEHEYMATHDVVCDIPNRLLFLDRLNHALAHSDRSGESLALVFIDLDGFKPVNDGLGHDAGDFVLSTVACRIQDHIRETDTIARISGDEFAVLLPRCDDAMNLDQVLQNIKRVVSEPVMYQSFTSSVTASIGVSSYPKDAANRHNLMYFADLAMFEAKEQGGNRIRYFRESMVDGRQRRRQLENDLREALDKKELLLHYQPVRQITDNSLYAIEVLLHWPRSCQGGDMNHTSIQRAAEDSRLGVRLGHYMLEKLGADMERLVQSGAKRLTVNCNIGQLRHNGFVEALAEISKLWNSFGRECYVEIAESEIARDKKAVVSAIRKLNKYQIKCVLDHFGASQASLSYLKAVDFAVDAVKIDRSYICDIHSDKRDRAVLKAIISLVTDLELDCIALGVETVEQDECLKANGCHLAQGGYYSHSLSLGDLPRQAGNISLLKSHR